MPPCRGSARSVASGTSATPIASSALARSSSHTSTSNDCAPRLPVLNISRSPHAGSLVFHTVVL